MLDVHGALLDARATGRARPEHVLIDDSVRAMRIVCRERAREVVAGRPHKAEFGPVDGIGGVTGGVGPHQFERPLAVATFLAQGTQVGRLGLRVVAKGHHEEFGGEWLVGVPRRALRLAAPALGAGREVEQALPREVLDLADPEDGLRGILVLDLPEGLHGLERERLALAHGHRLESTQSRPPGGFALEPDVREGQEAVPRDTHRRLQRDGDHPRERHEDLDHRDQVDPVRQCRQRQARPDPRQPTRQREVQPQRGRRFVQLDDGGLQGPQHEDAEADREDRELHVVGLPPRRSEES